jgi:D-tyrosyl-tRNA(Tyr) deacylase
LALLSDVILAIAILQRVASASVTVDKQLVASIGRGVLVFAAVAPGDTEREIEAMAAKVLKMKLWPDEHGLNVRSSIRFTTLSDIGKWKKNVSEIHGDVLCGMNDSKKLVYKSSSYISSLSIHSTRVYKERK